MNKHNTGFTVIELLFIIVILVAASVLFFVQKNNLEVASRDEIRKISINSMHHSLEEVFFRQNNYYPISINSETLPSVDPDLFVDPYDIEIGDGESDYKYTPENCEDNKCKSYRLSASLENEADYTKESNNS